MRIKRYMAVAMLAASVGMAGCGGAGGKKGESDKAATGDAVVAGRVDLYSGYGVAADGAGRAEALRAGATARLYRIPPDGTALLPLPGSAATTVNNGVFRITGAPAGESALVVRVETGDGKPTLSAILPPLSAGTNSVAVNPETDIEARLLRKMTESGIAKKRDAKPWEIDASFVKQLVDEALFFENGGPGDPEKTADKLLPVARAAHAKYTEMLFGAGTAADDARMAALVRGIAGPLTRLEAAREAGAATDALREAAEVAVAKESKEAKLARGTLTDVAAWRTARDMSLDWAARCMRQGVRGAGCPAVADGTFDMPAYGAALGRALAAAGRGEDARGRMKAFAADGASEAVPSPLEAVSLLISPTKTVLEDFRDEAAKIDAEKDVAKRFELKRKWASDLRDVLIIGEIGLEAGEAYESFEGLTAAERKMAEALNGAEADMGKAVAAHAKFLAEAEAALKPVGETARSRFVKLDAADAGRLEWALREICMNATLWSLPTEYYDGPDSDGDGASDIEERIAGTDPADAGSVPAPILTAVPSVLLPAPPADTDGDGYSDRIERAAGTDLASAASKPVPGKMKFCEAGKAACVVAPGAAKAGTSRLHGKVEHKGKPVGGATVGLYASARFLNEKPMSGTVAVSGADGKYTIEKAPKGKYFVAAFRDSDGDGAPGDGEAVGFAGNVYPARITAGGENPEGETAVVMIGAAGALRCAKGKVYDHAAKKCVDKCPAGMTAFEITGECECGVGKLLVTATGECAAACPATMRTAAGAGRCECPEGAAYGAETKECECGAGMKLDRATMMCACEKGLLVEGRGGCVEECPPGRVANEKAGVCECPPESRYDRTAGRCVCEAGKIMNPAVAECADACAGGMKPDATGYECACGDRERYDAELKRCECAEGLMRGKDGVCGAVERGPEPRGEAPAVERGGAGATRSVVAPERKNLIPLDR
ncbi:MAG TPA: hypothetical protein PLK80_01100 [bacterium]|nr:hypothetical protein [bacterium]